MQLFFGATGSALPAVQIRDQLIAASIESNPDVNPSVVSGARLALGYVSRAYTQWRGDDPNLRLFLDGEILFLDGVPLQHRGAAPEELAAVAQLYRRQGSDFWTRLDGNFCLIVEDRGTTHIGVDPTGTRSVYWWRHHDTLAFHSYLVDLAPTYPGELTEDYGAIGNFLACGAYPPGRTPYNEIQHLSSGCYLTFTEGRVQVREHFHMTCENKPEGRSHETLVSELIELVSESIRACWNPARRPAVLLSGGLDSRYIAAEVTRQAGDKSLVHTISYGEKRGQEGDDGFVASQVATALGVKNSWFEVNHDHQENSFERTIYLTSGADDSAILYPDHYLMHQELADRGGFGSIFRGDHCFGRGLRLITRRTLLVSNQIMRLAVDDHGYREYISDDLFMPMVQEQSVFLASLLENLQSDTATGCRDEVYYGVRVRQVLAPANRIKHADLEVYDPLLSRRLLEWDRRIPDTFRHNKMLFRDAFKRRFPELQAIPAATARNQGSWDSRFRHDRKLLRFFYDWCAAPGWLDKTGGKQKLLTTLKAMEAGSGAPMSVTGEKPPLASWKKTVRNSFPGRFYRELILEKKLSTPLQPQFKIGRLAILHGLLGRIETRKSEQRAYAYT